MKRWTILAAAVVLLALAPKTSTDVGELLPVELLYLYKVGDELHADTDAGAQGVGTDLNTALEDLHATASGVVFLDTADYLILAPETLDLIPELKGLLRPATKVCIGLHVDTEAAAYLAAHTPQKSLGQLRPGEDKLPILTRREAGYRLDY